MIRSMTGFGAADGDVGSARVSVEIRTVNHRFFNPSLKIPAIYQRWEGEIRDFLRKRIARGHVSLSIRQDRDAAAATLDIDEARLSGYVTQLRGVSTRLGLDPSLDLATLLRLPEVLGSGTEQEAPGELSELLSVVERAVTALTEMRDAEGARLSTFLHERLQVIADALDRIDARAPQRLVAQRDRLRANVRELADGAGIDEQRLAQEVAILADRLDVQEELSRFRAHLVAFREAMSGPGEEAVGKRLGFLLQEMLREANTTGSKANDIDIRADVMLVKEELERLREQVENLE